MTTKTTRAGTEFEQKFINRLDELRKNTGTMAALRRGLGKPPGTVADMHPYVLPWVSGFSNTRDENPFYVVAALFAFWHQGKEGTYREAPWNLGASLGRLRDDSDSIEKRFVALLNSHEDDLPVRLRHAVGLLRSKTPAIPVNWLQLLSDLRGWGWESRSVQRNWARGFWKFDAVTEDEEPSPDDGLSSADETA
tara:strand:- start:60937 stop:61518 length:582 start_codon:yes stop_codon:yes gene_type:complete